MPAAYVLGTHRSSSWKWGAVAVVLAVVAAGLFGCGQTSDVPVGQPAENIRKLSLAYVQYAAAHQGVGPANKDALKKFMVERSDISPEEAEARFTSPRDQQPYVIRWAQRSKGYSHPAIIIFESQGADGTRYVANDLMSIQELTDDQFAEAVPSESGSSH